MRRVVLLLLLAGILLYCLGPFLSLAATTDSDVPEVLSVPAGAHVDRVANAPAPDASYPLMPPAEGIQETDKRPVNASLLMMLVLAIASFGVSFIWLLTVNARRRGATCSWGFVRASLSTTCEEPSFLGVFLL
jgi:hypothetical protein